MRARRTGSIADAEHLGIITREEERDIEIVMTRKVLIYMVKSYDTRSFHFRRFIYRKYSYFLFRYRFECNYDPFIHRENVRQVVRCIIK